MKTIIIEDEQLAVERLSLLLLQYDRDIQVVHTMDSVEESVTWLQTQPAPDLILLDIHLSDGSAFDIFKQLKISSPVIFTTAYDHYAIDAFKVLSIDYLLKPVDPEELKQAVDRYLTQREEKIQLKELYKQAAANMKDILSEEQINKLKEIRKAKKS